MHLLQFDPALVVDINFIKPDHKKPTESSTPTSTATQPSTRQSLMVQQSKVNVDSFYQALHAIIPGACIFTSVPVPSAELESDVVTTAMATVSCTPAAAECQPDVRDAPNDESGSVLTVADNEADECQTPVADIAECHTPVVDTANSEVADYPIPVTDSADNELIPAPLTALHQQKYEHLNNDELKKEAEEVFCAMTISDQEANEIKKATITQHDSVLWREQRNGRLTASVFHDVYVRKESTNPEPLVKRIMGYEQSDLSYVPAINWGVQNEGVARQQYTTMMSAGHEGFTCNLSGLWINPLYPHFGVSPDGITTCSCCGDGLLEIKCPFSARHAGSLNNETCAFLTDSGYLSRKHRYYTQVQGQLMVSGQLFCDFFIWTPTVYKVERIHPDVHFWEKLEKRLTSFFVANVLPEIMTCRLKHDDDDSDEENQVYCTCQKRSTGRMIACDNRQCKHKWFHYKCVGIKRAPKGDWFCTDCKIVKLA